MFDQTITVNSLLLAKLHSNASRFYYLCRLLDKQGSGKTLINVEETLNLLNFSLKTFKRLLANNVIVRGVNHCDDKNLVEVFYCSENKVAKDIGVTSLNNCAFVDVTFNELVVSPKKLGRLLTVKYLNKKNYNGLQKQLHNSSSTKVVLPKVKSGDDCKTFFKQTQGLSLQRHSNNDVIVIDKDKVVSYQNSLVNISSKFGKCFSYSTLVKDFKKVDKFICYQCDDNNYNNYMLNKLTKQCEEVIFFSKALGKYVRKLPNVIPFNDYYFFNKQHKRNKFNLLTTTSGQPVVCGV
jgi:hypothetical protein